jgi:hypothetical protein
VGRRHLRLVAALALALAAAAPAGAASLRWKEFARGEADLAQLANPVAFVAANRTAAYSFAVGLPRDGNVKLDKIDYKRNLALAFFGDFGCKDHRVAVQSVTRAGKKLRVSLLVERLGQGRTECQAIYTTYRVLLLPKSQLQRPFPTSAEVRVARA